MTSEDTEWVSCETAEDCRRALMLALERVSIWAVTHQEKVDFLRGWAGFAASNDGKVTLQVTPDWKQVRIVTNEYVASRESP